MDFDPRKIIPAREILKDLDWSVLRELAREKERTTEYGSPAYFSRIRARSAPFTKSTETGTVTAEDKREIKRVIESQKNNIFIQIDRTMCDPSTGTSYGCRLLTTRYHADLALMFESSLFPPAPDQKIDFTTIDIPEYELERRILLNPRTGVTYVLGSDYYGEVKKSFLRMTMYQVKQEGKLGLHAGSKEVWAKSRASGKIKRSGMIFFGLSGTGKTSLTCHDFSLNKDEGEGMIIRQDDVVILDQDGSCRGTEGRGYFIKTEDLNQEEQPSLYQAAVADDAVFHNVWVDHDGQVDFFNHQLTRNGRAVVRIARVPYTDKNIDLEQLDKVFFITRNRVMPPIGKLTPEQAAAAFMLGESVKTSAAGEDQVGKTVREVGTNPFIEGPPHEEGNLFYEILKANPSIECYILNTGRVGEDTHFRAIQLLDTVHILREIARDGVEWGEPKYHKFQVPVEIPGLELDRFHLARYYGIGRLEKLLKDLSRERHEWVENFPGLYPEIKKGIY